MPRASATTDFSERLLRWWHTNGRHDLPWQFERTPYRVWVAEIMLQQTRAATAAGYFERFVAKFPGLPALAQAGLDDVLGLWSGLGYYARARNLHAAARICMQRHGGRLPDSAAKLAALPGIGQSTANAIVAQAFDRHAPILDGNVKRVLARHAGIAGWPGQAAVIRRLWQEAEQRTPAGSAADYTQAVMDLGATVCTPRSPACPDCPVARDCVARRQGRIAELPARRPPRKRPRRQAVFLVIENEDGRIWLQRRAPAGIWGGLWCLPETRTGAPAEIGPQVVELETIEHHFTHFILDMRIWRLSAGDGTPIEDSERGLWVAPDQALDMGLPRPVRTVIENLAGVNS